MDPDGIGPREGDAVVRTASRVSRPLACQSLPVLSEVVGRTRPLRIVLRRSLMEQPELRELFRLVRTMLGAA